MMVAFKSQSKRIFGFINLIQNFIKRWPFVYLDDLRIKKKVKKLMVKIYITTPIFLKSK